MALERKRKNAVEEVVEIVERKPRWKVINGGITLLDRRSYAKGEIFEAWDYEVPEAFRDIVKCLDTVNALPAKAKMTYSLREVIGTAEEMDEETYVPLFQIIDENDKVITEAALPKKVVEPLLKELNK